MALTTVGRHLKVPLFALLDSRDENLAQRNQMSIIFGWGTRLGRILTLPPWGRDGALRRPRRRAKRQAAQRITHRLRLAPSFRPLRRGRGNTGQWFLPFGGNSRTRPCAS